MRGVILLVGRIMVIAAIAGALPARAHAQGLAATAPRSGRMTIRGATPVVITAVDDFKYKGSKAVIVRRTTMMPHDVILVKKEHVNPRFLADAVFKLQAVRSAFGDIPTRDAVYRVTPRDKEGKRTTEAIGWANTLATTRENELEGYGPVKQVILYLPNSVRR
jgi:hypothetical protein